MGSFGDRVPLHGSISVVSQVGHFSLRFGLCVVGCRVGSIHALDGLVSLGVSLLCSLPQGFVLGLEVLVDRCYHGGLILRVLEKGFEFFERGLGPTLIQLELLLQLSTHLTAACLFL